MSDRLAPSRAALRTPPPDAGGNVYKEPLYRGEGQRQPGRDKADKCPECPATLDPVAEIPAADRFGPWSDRIDGAERVARLRSLRAIVRLSTGPRGERLAVLLHRAERDASALAPALDALNALAALDRRSVLGSFAALHRPA